MSTNSDQKAFFRRPKPKVLVEIKKNTHPFKRVHRRVDLSGARIFVVPVRAIVSIFVVVLASASLFLGSVSAPVGNSSAWPITLAAQNEEERRVLENQLGELEKQIEEQESLITAYKKQGVSLSSEIKRLNARISQLNLQLQAVELSISKLDKEIVATTNRIGEVDGDIMSNKGLLIKILQSLYEKQDTTMAVILLENPRLSDFFDQINSLLLVQDNLRVTLLKIRDLKNELVEQKEHLGLERADAASIKAYRDTQKAELANTKKEKNQVLEVTKGQEAKYKQLAEENKKKASEIRNKIFRLLGGGELPFGEAVKLAQVAERATGVRAALILSVLTQESSIDGVIGKNLGRCYYNTSRNNKSGTVMSDSQKPLFLALMSSLGLDAEKTPVSCPIASDGAYGGAMGPAQFMPATWELYKDRVAQVTGGSPANPFNNLDAFVATSLYLKDGLQCCRTIYKTIFSQENCAAAKYYAGGKWRYYTTVGRYGYRVADRAEEFQKDIEVLDS